MVRGFTATTSRAPRGRDAELVNFAEGAVAAAERALRAEALRAVTPEACRSEVVCRGNVGSAGVGGIAARARGDHRVEKIGRPQKRVLDKATALQYDLNLKMDAAPDARPSARRDHRRDTTRVVR